MENSSLWRRCCSVCAICLHCRLSDGLAPSVSMCLVCVCVYVCISGEWLSSLFFIACSRALHSPSTEGHNEVAASLGWPAMARTGREITSWRVSLCVCVSTCVCACTTVCKCVCVRHNSLIRNWFNSFTSGSPEHHTFWTSWPFTFRNVKSSCIKHESNSRAAG